jgi:hypothetical protein
LTQTRPPTKLSENLLILTYCFLEVGKCEVYVDWLIIIALLRAKWLAKTIRLQCASVPEGGHFEVQSKVFAEPMNIIHDQRLVLARQVIEIIDLKEYCFGRF